jgi:hypothetical protein
VHPIKPILMALAGVTLLSPAAPQLATTDAVLEKYQQALGGVDAIKNVQSQTVRAPWRIPMDSLPRSSSTTPNLSRLSSK